MRKFSTYLSNIPLLAAIASILWVFDGVLLRAVSPSVHPLTIVFYQLLVATILIIPVAGYSIFKEKPTVKEMSILAIFSLLSGPISMGLFTFALFQTSTTSFTSIYILQKLQPLFAIFFIWIAVRRKFHPKFFGYALLTLTGAFLMIAGQSIVSGQWQFTSLEGGLAAFAAVLISGISAIFSLAALKENSHQFVTISQFFFGALFSLIGILLFSHQPLSQALFLPHVKDSVLVISLGICITLISFIIYFRALQDISKLNTVFLELLYPALALVIDLAIYHHAPNFLELFGMGTVVFAIIKINRLHNFTDLKEI